MFTQENLELKVYLIEGVLMLASSEEEAVKESQLFEEMSEEWAWDEKQGIEEILRMSL